MPVVQVMRSALERGGDPDRRFSSWAEAERQTHGSSQDEEQAQKVQDGRHV